MNTIVGSTALVLAAFVLWIPTRVATLIAFAACYGFTSGAFIALVPPVVAQISEIHEIGVRTGMVYGVASLSCLTGIPIAGALLLPGEDGSATYRWLQAFCMAAVGLGICFLLAMRLSHSRGMRRV